MGMFNLHVLVVVDIVIECDHLHERIKSFMINTPTDIDNLEVMTYAMQLANSELTKTGTIYYDIDSVYFKDDEPEEGLTGFVSFKDIKILREWYENLYKVEQDYENDILSEKIDQIMMEN